MQMRNAQLGQRRSKGVVVDTPGDAVVDLGMALVAFGAALQAIGTRLQAHQRQPAVSPQAPAPAPSAPVTSGLPAEGYVRIWDIIGRKATKGRSAIPGMIPVSRATWYSGVKSGRFPKPIKHSGIAMWRVEDIRALVAQLGH
jgi:prophage regulatory protein